MIFVGNGSTGIGTIGNGLVDIVCTLPPFLQSGGGGRVEPPTKFSKRDGFTGPQLLDRGCWERGGGNFFQGWLQVAIFTKR